ncbi:MAG TPA: Rieske 2Fe-2S domain-containing protein [Miltoncostaeaceae bacterium]|nr:Rieske 2Fe-2S domain-containing protein [Miltoncostaeaceae bacterium]
MAEAQGDGNGGRYTGPVAGDATPEKDPHDDPAYITRTKFLSGVAVVTGGVLTAAILVPVVGFAVADTVKEEEWQWVDVGPLSDYPDGEVGSIAVSGPSPESDRRAYVRHKDGSIIAIWNRCAHLGCPVAYSAGGDVYSCPCHGGAYDSLGLVTAGPPPRPLDRFDVKIVTASGQPVAEQEQPSQGCPTNGAKPGDRVLIGRPFSIDGDQNPYQLKGPGEPVTGVLANLYPF